MLYIGNMYWQGICGVQALKSLKQEVETCPIFRNLNYRISGTTHCKMKEYAQEAQDTQIKQFFEKGAQSAMQNKQQLMKFLG